MIKIAIVRDPLYLKHSNFNYNYNLNSNSDSNFDSNSNSDSNPNANANIAGHPESPKRPKAIDMMLEGCSFKSQIKDIPARDAAFNELLWVHTREYIKKIENTKARGFTALDPDTGANSDSFAAAIRAAGGTMNAINAVLRDQFNGAFAFIRPPGHHAEHDRAMGFCLFNNIAIGALYAIKTHGLKRVLIVDWDVHHGNGTMKTFYESDKVMYFSIHEYPHYPGTGRINETGLKAGQGYTINVPLIGGQGDNEYMNIFKNIFKPIALKFAPQLILVSAGFDAHEKDRLSNMSVTSNGYGRMMRAVMDVAEQCCEGKIVLVLEGGYNLSGLKESISNVLCTLLGKKIAPETGSLAVNDYISKVIQDVMSAQKSYF